MGLICLKCMTVILNSMLKPIPFSLWSTLTAYAITPHLKWKEEMSWLFSLYFSRKRTLQTGILGTDYQWISSVWYSYSLNYYKEKCKTSLCFYFEHVLQGYVSGTLFVTWKLKFISHYQIKYLYKAKNWEKWGIPTSLLIVEDPFENPVHVSCLFIRLNGYFRSA